MQVQSRPNNFDQASRPSLSERQQSEPETVATVGRVRRDDAITGSQSVLSSSLADALWSIQRSSATEDNVPARSLEDVYRAYAA